MVYLIGQLAGWLLLTAAFSALAGWAFAAQRAAAGDARDRRDREHLIRDLVGMASGEGAKSSGIEHERAIDVARRMSELNNGRITELEQQLAAARARADEASARAAEFERALAAPEQDVRTAIDVDARPAPPAPEAEPAPSDDEVALQAWRLRYFEQRVKYLEENGRAPAPLAAIPEPETVPPLQDWQTRIARLEAEHLADELRADSAAPAEPEGASPFAANADVDTLLRWRMLYLERRVVHLQSELAEEPQSVAAPIAEPVETGPDPDRWKWRARYLEARARHLEQRLTETPAPAPTIVRVAAPVEAPAEAPASPPRPATRGAKPPVLSAPRNGAPDDLTLIDGVSLLQQTTLYSLGVFHYDQIAAWAPEHVAWVDNYLRLRGRIDDEEWIEQAADLAREGPSAARRMLEEEDA